MPAPNFADDPRVKAIEELIKPCEIAYCNLVVASSKQYKCSVHGNTWFVAETAPVPTCCRTWEDRFFVYAPDLVAFLLEDRKRLKKCFGEVTAIAQEMNDARWGYSSDFVEVLDRLIAIGEAMEPQDER